MPGRRFEDIDLSECPNTETVKKHDEDLYHGDARKAGITTRMEQVEDRMDSFSGNVNKMVWAIVAVALAVLGEIIQKALVH
jgi:hypothetical protein